LRRQGERRRIRDKLRREKEHRTLVLQKEITDVVCCDAEIIKYYVSLNIIFPIPIKT
jgi:hypothetical protein